MLRLAVQPPPHANPGVPLYPPLVARLSSERSIYAELSQIWAAVTLIHYSGDVSHDQLGGSVADSAHPLPEGGPGTNDARGERDRAYFYFPGLVINEPGRYRIRVSLMRMDYPPDGLTEGVVRVLETADSRSIAVDDGNVNYSRPSKQPQLCVVQVLTIPDSRERAFLRVLKDDGQDIPSPH
jgi:hypothetical protein